MRGPDRDDITFFVSCSCGFCEVCSSAVEQNAVITAHKLDAIIEYLGMNFTVTTN